MGGASAPGVGFFFAGSSCRPGSAESLLVAGTGILRPCPDTGRGGGVERVTATERKASVVSRPPRHFLSETPGTPWVSICVEGEPGPAIPGPPEAVISQGRQGLTGLDEDHANP
jgi:hypothetical protein